MKPGDLGICISPENYGKQLVILCEGGRRADYIAKGSTWQIETLEWFNAHDQLQQVSRKPPGTVMFALRAHVIPLLPPEAEEPRQTNLQQPKELTL